MKQAQMEQWITQLQAAKSAFEAMIGILVEEEGDWEGYLPREEERTVFPKEEEKETRRPMEREAKEEGPKETGFLEAEKEKEDAALEIGEKHGAVQPKEETKEEEALLMQMAKKRYGSQEGSRVLFFLEEKDLLRDENGTLLAVDFTGAREALGQFLKGQAKVEGTGMQWGTRKQENDRFVAGARRGAKLRG